MLPRPPRLFEADDVLSGRVDLAGYPFRLIYLVISLPTFWAENPIHPSDHGRVDVLLSAAELLEERGWEVVSVDAGGKLICLRRRSA